MIEIKNFISEQECKYIIKLINKNNHKSQVIGPEGKSIYDTSRTSSTANLPGDDDIIIKLKNKIANYLNIPVKNGESLQGQMYNENEYFKPHFDAFAGNSYKTNAGKAGNRTNTLMIYLNNNFVGGGTNFVNLNKVICPEIGKAVTWQNIDKNKNIIESSMHEGMPVSSGIKYIITSWWRENKWG